MLQFMRRILLFILVFAVLFIPLKAYIPTDLANEKDVLTTLWVLTEPSLSDGMNMQAEQIAHWMEENYKNVDVLLEILPTDMNEREVRLSQLRTQIMAGNGPDVYLLPTGNTLYSDYSESTLIRSAFEITVEPLFTDVSQAMASGIFADIQTLYNADNELGKASLQAEVMEAGVLNGSRYVLPLRYTMPVILTDSSRWEAFGITEELLDSDILSLTQYSLDHDSSNLAIGIRLADNMSFLSQIFDYRHGEISISVGEISEYMRLYQSYYAQMTDPIKNLIQSHTDAYINQVDEDLRFLIKADLNLDSFNYIRYYTNYKTNWHDAGLPVYICDLADTLHAAAIAEVAEYNLEMHPLRSSDGSVVAEVTYYGAVGSSCSNVDLAYAFLRQFLNEEYQWETYRPRVEKSYSLSEVKHREVQNPGLVEDSWPVRTAEATQHLWSNIQYQSFGFYTDSISETITRSKLFQKTDFVLSDEDIPVLSFSVDEVRFPPYLPYEETLGYALTLLNNEGGTPTDVDIEKLAQKVYQNLWWHLAEG